MTTGRPLSDDALTIWTAAQVIRGRIEAPVAVPLEAIQADLATVSEQHTNPNLAAIAGSAAMANPFVHPVEQSADIITIR